MKKHQWRRLVSVISVWGMLCSCSSVSAEGIRTESAATTAAEPVYEELHTLPPNIQRLLSDTAADDVVVPSDNPYELTVQHADGSYTTEVYAVPVKYQDDEGDTHYIDTSMRDRSLLDILSFDRAYHNQEGYVDLSYAFDVTDGVGVDDAFTLSIPEQEGQEKANSTQTADGAGKVIYPRAFGEDTYVEYINTYAGFKENIVLEKHIGRNTFDFVWTSDTHVPVLIDDDKAIQIVSKDDPTQVDYTISPLYVYDSFDPTTADDPYSHKHWTEDCRYDILPQEDGTYIIRAIVSEEFLNHPETVYPVTIDPSVTADAAASNVEDGFVKESAKTGKYGTYDYLQFGYLGGRIYSYVRFITLPTIEKGAYFTSATFKVTFRTGQNTPAQMKATAKEISGDFSEKTLCWNNRPAHKTVQSSVLPQVTNGYLDYYNFTVTAAVRNWYTNVNYGLMFDYATETYNDYNSVVSSEGDAARSPKLTINYTKPAAQTSGITNDAYYFIKNVSTGKYLSIPSNTYTVDQEAYTGKSNQLWKVHYYGNGSYLISSAAGSNDYLCAGMDIDGGAVFIDNTVSDDTQILIVPTAAGDYRITSRYISSYWALTAGRYDSTSVEAYMYTGAADQRWVFEKCGFSISNAESNAGVKVGRYNGKFYRDYTVPLNNLLKTAKELAEDHRCMSWTQYCAWVYDISVLMEPSLSEHAGMTLGSFTWFYGQVNHDAVWDIKRPNRWKAALPNVPYLGLETEFLFRGNLTTAEGMGNILYGYAGRATGFGAVTLYWGGGVAAKGSLNDPEVNTPPNYGDDKNDHLNIELGYNMFHADYPNYPGVGYDGIPVEEGIIAAVGDLILNPGT